MFVPRCSIPRSPGDVAPSQLAARLLGLAFCCITLNPSTAEAASVWWGARVRHAASAEASRLHRFSAPPAFHLSLGRRHPLAGRLFDVRRGRFVTPSQMLDDLAGADMVLLGERHDNPDHHRLQAWIIDAIAGDKRRPRVVFEMIDAEKQRDVDRSLREYASGVDQLGEALAWDKSGWPPFAMYRPIFAAAVSRGLPIVAAGLSRSRLAAEEFVSAESLEGEDPVLRVALPERLRDAMAADIRESHCGYAHEAMITTMIAVQRRRDLTMARAMLAAGRGPGNGAVLVAGFGHVRSDYGVPMVLRDLDASAAVRSVGFIEVQSDARRPAVYAEELRAETLPFDYVWFTPRANDDDPCEEFRTQLQTIGSKGGAGGSGTAKKGAGNPDAAREILPPSR